MPLPKSVPAMDLVVRFNAGEKSAKDKVRAALKKAGSVDGARKILGISRSTLFLWVQSDPSLRDELGSQKPGPKPQKPHAPTKKREGA